MFRLLRQAAIIARLYDERVATLVTIRLARHGGRNRPFYHITVAERSAKRDGRFIERLGFYNPVARGAEEELRLDLPRLEHWLSVGAQPTPRVGRLVKRWRGQLQAQAAGEDAASEPAGEAASSEQAVAEP